MSTHSEPKQNAQLDNLYAKANKIVELLWQNVETMQEEYGEDVSLDMISSKAKILRESLAAIKEAVQIQKIIEPREQPTLADLLTQILRSKTQNRLEDEY